MERALLLLVTWTACCVTDSLFFDFEVRNQHLLANLRREMKTDILADLLTENAFNDINEMKFYDNDGTPTTCWAEKDFVSTEKIATNNVQKLLEALHRTCIMLPQSWWSYEYCHREELYQFHVETVNKKTVRNPEQRLGKYHSTKLYGVDGAEVEDTSTTEVSKIVDYYIDGSECEETKRTSQVTISCCPDQAATFTKTGSLALLKSVNEKQTCKYEFEVCANALCPSAPLSLESIMAPCLMLSEGWWTYELCPNSHIKQFHVEVEVAKVVAATSTMSGKVDEAALKSIGTALEQSTTITASHDLGRMDNLDNYNNNKQQTKTKKMDWMTYLTAPEAEAVNADYDYRSIYSDPSIHTSTFSVAATIARTSKLIVNYPQGDVCDLTGVRRSTTIEYQCDLHFNRLISVLEVSTCNYHATVGLVGLCNVAGFKPTVPPQGHLACKK